MKTSAQLTTCPVRTISYAPESIRPKRRTESVSGQKPAWILCRNLAQCAIADDQTLLRWTLQGRVRPADYLVSNRLDRCVQAREIAELDAIFRSGTARRLETAARALAVGSLALVWIGPLLACLAVLGAIAVTVVSIGTTSPRRRKYIAKQLEA